MVTIVGKLNGYDIVPLAEDDFEQIAGDPVVGDVYMRNGKVYARSTQHTFDVTDRFFDLVGWEIPEHPIRYEDVL